MTHDQPDPRRWKALAVSLSAGFMGLLDVSIVNVALPSMQSGLGASAGAVQWVVSGYALAFGLTLVAGGRLGDALGRRTMFLVSLGGFVLTSALAGMATDTTTLIVARLLQGACAGLLNPQNSGLIQDLFRGPERGRAFGLLGACIGVSTAVGPVLGGVIIALFGAEHGWRWVFYVNLPIGLVALAFAVRLLPADRRRPARVRDEIDVVGALLLGLAVLCVLFPLVQFENDGLARFWWLFPLAVVLGWVFVRWERHTVHKGRSPLLDTRLFTETPGYSSGAAIGAAYFCGFTGVFVVLSMFFQTGQGYTALESGLVVTPFALASALAAGLAGRAVARFGRRMTILGLCLVAGGFTVAGVLALTAPETWLGAWVALPLAVAGLGGGMVISPNTTMTLENVRGEMAGVAGAVLQTGQRIGTAIGAALLVAAFHVVAAEAGGRAGLAVALACAVALVLVALGLAVRERRG
ncbi:MFS transporter [Allokutzneria sp. NRRL B-24872]|uniref:MFS transporter n=1 Tax=Allokutzneria sp. NRRL B-24872 TaxID=1137961 RepID=UPI000A3800F7|nr:MFS transporter [Allokutzneria sp. NRRL B-24872]